MPSHIPDMLALILVVYGGAKFSSNYVISRRSYAKRVVIRTIGYFSILLAIFLLWLNWKREGGVNLGFHSGIAILMRDAAFVGAGFGSILIWGGRKIVPRDKNGHITRIDAILGDLCITAGKVLIALGLIMALIS